MDPKQISELIEAGFENAYKTLGSLVGNEIHALSIRALTPDEWQQQGSQ